MAVIINDFEVIAEPPPSQAPKAPTPADTSAPPPSASTPRDIERILQHLEERLDRVWAH